VCFLKSKRDNVKTSYIDEEKLFPIVGRDEMNLAEFAIGLASERNVKKIKTVQRSQTQFLPDGRRVEQAWIITGSDAHGLPLAGDDDILLALIKLAFDQGLENRRVHFSRYKILEILELDHKGRNYERIERALERLSGVRILAQNSFWDNARKTYVSLNFGIIDNYCIVEGKRHFSEAKKHMLQDQFPFAYVSFNEEFFTSLKSGNVKRLDMNYYNKLKSGVSRRLFRYLDKRKFQRPTLTFDIRTLAEVNLGLDLERRQYSSQIRQKLDLAHTELNETGFLGAWSYSEKQKGRWQVTYHFDSHSRALKTGSSKDLDPLVKELMERGMAQRPATMLVKSYGESIEAKLEMFDYLRSVRSPLLSRNPLGWLRKAIEDDYLNVPGFRTREERQQRAELIQEEQQKEKALKDAQHQMCLDYWQHYQALSVDRQAELLIEAKSKLSFMPLNKQKTLTLENPLVKAAIIDLLAHQHKN